jgi:hypothetical protein
MLYNLANPLQAESFKLRCKRLIEAKCAVELKSKKVRTLASNRYLHVTISYVAGFLGETTDYVKRNYFKLCANRDLFLRTRHDNIVGREVQYLRSSSQLTTEEMSIAIDRWRDFSAQTIGLYIPSPEERELVFQMEIEVGRANE